MLTTKSKINDSKLTIYERIRDLHNEDAKEMAGMLIEEGRSHQVVTVVYSILINESVSVTTKFNALTLVRAVFQTGNHTNFIQDIVPQSTRLNASCQYWRTSLPFESIRQ